jgi:capsular exopolysaccharide synthesis family protein
MQLEEFTQLNKVDLKEYLETILNRKDVFLVSFLIPLVLGSIFIFTRKPMFRATTQLEVNSGVIMPVTTQVYRDRDGSESYNYLMTQLEILQGKELKDRVSKALADWKMKIPLRYLEPKTTIKFAQGNVISIWADNPYKDYAIAYAEAIVKEFMDLKMEQKEKSSNFAVAGLTRQADQLNEKIRGIQKKIQEFKEQNNEVLLEDGSSFSASYLAKLSNKASDIKTEKVLIEKQIKALEESDDPSFWISVIDEMQRGVVTPAISKEAQQEATLNSVSTVTSTDPKKKVQDKNASVVKNTSTIEQLPFIFVLEKGQSKYWEDLRSRYEKLKSEFFRISKLYKPEHPQREKVEAELNAAVKDMSAEVSSLLEKFKAKYEQLKIEEQAVNEELKNWQTTAIDSSSKINQFSVLKDEEERLKKLYQVLVDRIEELSVATDFGLETVNVVQAARVEPLPSKLFRNVFLLLLFSMCCGCGTVFFIDYIDDSIKSPDDLKKYTGLSSLGMIYSIEWDQKDLPSHKLSRLQEGSIIESYRSIRTNILLSRPESMLKTILMTSALPSEGKTTTSVNTSIVLAQGGLRVLLIDADMRRPTIHKIFNLKNEKGLSSVLAETESFDKCLQKTDIENLDLLPAGHIVSDPPKLFHASKIKDFIKVLNARYDRIIIDSAPILTVIDSVILSDLADGIVFVVHGGVTSRIALIKAKEALLDNSSRLLGVIVNNMSFKKMSGHYYYYGYKYKYRYDYGKKPNSEDKNKDKEIEEAIA